MILQLVSIITKVVRWNSVHGKVYLIQHYVIKIVGDMRQVSGFIWGLRLPLPKKHCHDITEILLKVVLNTINQTLYDLTTAMLQQKYGFYT